MEQLTRTNAELIGQTVTRLLQQPDLDHTHQPIEIEHDFGATIVCLHAVKTGTDHDVAISVAIRHDGTTTVHRREWDADADEMGSWEDAELV